MPEMPLWRLLQVVKAAAFYISGRCQGTFVQRGEKIVKGEKIMKNDRKYKKLEKEILKESEKEPEREAEKGGRTRCGRYRKDWQ